MAAGTVLSKDDLPAFNLGAVGCHKCTAARYMCQPGSFHPHQELCQVLHAACGGHPIYGTPLGLCDFEWALSSTSDQRIVIPQRLLTVLTDADIHTAEGTDYADRISTVLQDMRYGHLLLFSRKIQRAT